MRSIDCRLSSARSPRWPPGRSRFTSAKGGDMPNKGMIFIRPGKDLTGRRFGRLVVLRREGRYPGGATTWSCRCDCGTVKTIARGNLIKGNTVSCGCYKREIDPDSPSKHPLYNTWFLMVKRCYDPECKRSERYGGRGIKVCSRWRESFRDFCEDIGPRPGPEYSIDRHPDPDGDYEPGNVRWATCAQQNRNRCTNRPIEFNGKTMLLIEWAEHLGINDGTLLGRLKRGWSIEKALMTPVLKFGEWNTRKGEIYTNQHTS
jgi:hypothetical protein